MYWRLLYLTLLMLTPQISWALDAAEEYEIKAAYLFNLGNFVKWPDKAIQEMVGVCILGEDPFGSNLDLIAKKERKLQNKTVIVKRISAVTDIQQCAILFVSNSEKVRLAAVLSEIKEKPILTVSDMDDFVVSGGMIQFYRRDGKIRLMIDPQTLDESHLKANSQLMKIAQLVGK